MNLGFYEGKKVLVPGRAGFIGSHLVDLKSQVTVIDCHVFDTSKLVGVVGIVLDITRAKQLLG